MLQAYDKKHDEDAMKSFVDEYKELRSEIRLFLEQGQKNIHSAFIVLAGVIVIGVRFKEPLLFLIGSLLVMLLWFNKVRCLVAVFRVATYIEIFIESKIPGLNWESYCGLHPIQGTVFDRIIANGVFPLLLGISSIYGLFIWECSFRLKITLIILLLVLIVALTLKSLQTARNGREIELKKWRLIKEKLNMKEKNSRRCKK